jgi:6-phosphofructokinase 1
MKFGHMVSLKGNDVTSVPVKEAILKLKTVPPDSQIVMAARAVGTSFGD